ncbi:hypothetical protein HYU96_04675 [Candidatus Daviesbacteria bacterium]|nr:hypothetical protein [Candidatus Daviesbacteria bacterium]
MSLKRLSIIAVYFLVGLILAGSVLAAAVVRITVQDQEIDLNDPGAKINIRLNGEKSQSIPIVITYDDGSTRYLGFIFNYEPPPAPPPAQTCPYQEDPQNCPYGGTRSCTGTWQGGVCKYDGAVDPACSETCNQAPAPRGCYDSQDFSEYVRCGGCGEEIWACYDEDGRHEKAFYGGDTAGYCTGPDWCGQSQPPPESQPEPEPSCDENVYFCEDGTVVHKYGGYWDGGSCQYYFDRLEPC